jgi:hypothetical protein
MANFEKKWMNEMKQKGLKLWKRYVDDVFATFNSQEESVVVLTLTLLNSKHPNIKFTLEKENSNRLPFLDITVVRTRMKFITTLYRKKTFTGVYLNWTSLTSRKYKIGLIQCLLDRVWRICTEEKDRLEEVRKMRLILEKNEYPTHIINKEIERFIQHRRSQRQEITTVEKARRFIVLPFVNRQAEHFGQRLKSLVEKSYPQVQFSTIFRAPDEIGKRFPFKDNIKKVEIKSLVVYNIKCRECNAQYIGKTEDFKSSVKRAQKQ